MKQIPMTANGLAKLKNELEELKNIKRPKIISAISEAREYGDLKENSEYRAAREEQAFCEGRIKEIENKIANSLVIDITKINPNGRVIFGSTVKILNINIDKIFQYKIVGDDESDLKKKLISVNSPIASGLIGKQVSDIVIIKIPSGQVKYKILKIEYI